MSKSGAKNRIYTRTGDDGTTSLLGGTRVSKAALRVETYGTIDELIASVALAAAEGSSRSAWPESAALLKAFQDDLMRSAAAVSAGSPADRKSLPALPADAVTALEKDIDRMDAESPALRSFILPGGSELSARLHVCRAVCRRAERRLIELAAVPGEEIPPNVGRYLNRLADWFFSAARYANHKAGTADTPWKTPKPS